MHLFLRRDDDDEIPVCSASLLCQKLSEMKMNRKDERLGESGRVSVCKCVCARVLLQFAPWRGKGTVHLFNPPASLGAFELGFCFNGFQFCFNFG